MGESTATADARELRRGPVHLLGHRAAGRWLVDELLQAGAAASVLLEEDFDPTRRAVVLLAGNANFYPRTVAELERASSGRGCHVVVWHFEPLPLPAASGFPPQPLHLRERTKVILRDSRATDPGTNIRLLRRLARAGLPDLLVVSSAGGQERLAEEGIAAAHVPLGSGPTHGSDLGLERDLDVSFLGALDVPRRKKALRALRRQGVAVEAVGGWGERHVRGEARTQLLNRSRIMLNLSRYPGQFSGQRLILGMVNGALVVSEPIYRPEPFVPGEHYVEATLEEMPAVVEHYLADDAERRRIAAAGHRLVTTELTRRHSVARLVELIDA